MPSDSDDIAIRVEDLRITYQTWVESEPTLVRSMQNLRRRKRSTETVNAVQGVSFEVPRGSVLGMVGPNGSGKSTILRALAGILRPTSGRITLHGRVTPLLSLGVGFNFQLSGHENIKLGGLLAGMELSEIREKTPEIIEFSGLGDAINRPVRTYSNGMFTRLAFSVAVFMDPEIILIDEVLAAGDAEFRFRSAEKILKLMEDDTTVVFVSHTHGELKALSDRCLWLEDGVVVQEGEPAAVVNAYEDHHGVHQPDLELDEEKGAFSFVWRPDGPGAGGPVAGSPTSS